VGLFYLKDLVRMAKDKAKLMEAAKLIKELKPIVERQKQKVQMEANVAFVDAQIALKQRQLTTLQDAFNENIRVIKKEILSKRGGLDASFFADD
jgi:hypothetical protein